MIDSMRMSLGLLFIFWLALLLLAACAQPDATPTSAPTTAVPTELQIITILPNNTIQAILEPKFVTGEKGSNQYENDELVLGVSINGDHRAYSIPFLSSKEIINDVVGGRAVVITW